MKSRVDGDLYKDTFLTIMSWLNSATVVMSLGGIFSAWIGIYVHWALGLICGAFIAIAAIASYIVYRK